MTERFGERLARLREEAGLTQKQLADAIGLTVQTISNWETGIRKPRLYLEETLALCQALSCNLTDLVGKSNVKTKKRTDSDHSSISDRQT